MNFINLAFLKLGQIEGERNVKVKNGIYVIKVGKEKVKMVVR